MSTSACRLTAAFAAVCAVGSAVLAQPQIPEGYEVVRLTDDLGIHSRPDINDRGDVVWSSSFPPDESDLFLFADGIIHRIVDDEYYNINPVINNNRVIAWRRAPSSSGPYEIAFDAGQGPQAIPSPGGITAIGAPDINDPGEIVWSQRLRLDPSRDEIFLFDGQSVCQITDNGQANQSARVNNKRQIAWGRFNYSVNPWTSTIMLYDQGTISALTDPHGEPASPDVNELGDVVWHCAYGCLTLGIQLWSEGITRVITDDGRNPRISGSREIVFARWNESEQKWNTMLYRGDEFFRLPDFDYSSAGGSINNRGEVVWRVLHTTTGDTGILVMRRTAPKGDLDGDCHIDARDYRGFQICYTGADRGPLGGFLGNCSRGDFDDDGDIDREDFRAFLQAYTGPGRVIPGCKP